MKCPTCLKGDHRILRTDQEENVIERLRECASCGRRWKTTEAPSEVLQRASDIVAAFEGMKRAIPGAE